MRTIEPTLNTELFASAIENDDARFPSTMQAMLKAVRNHLHMDVGFVSRIEDGRRSFDFVDGDESCPVKAGDSNPVESSYCQRVVDGRLPELITDATKLEAARDLPATHSIPVGAHLSVPIHLENGDTYGTFCCFSRQADSTITVRDLEFMRAFADFAGMQISRHEAVKQQENAAKQEIQEVLNNGWLNMVFQPIVDVQSQSLLGFESLARFNTVPSYLLKPDQTGSKLTSCFTGAGFTWALPPRPAPSPPQADTVELTA